MFVLVIIALSFIKERSFEILVLNRLLAKILIERGTPIPEVLHAKFRDLILLKKGDIHYDGTTRTLMVGFSTHSWRYMATHSGNIRKHLLTRCIVDWAWTEESRQTTPGLHKTSKPGASEIWIFAIRKSAASELLRRAAICGRFSVRSCAKQCSKDVDFLSLLCVFPCRNTRRRYRPLRRLCAAAALLTRNNSRHGIQQV